MTALKFLLPLPIASESQREIPLLEELCREFVVG
jgi:hypothetical protein